MESTRERENLVAKCMIHSCSEVYMVVTCVEGAILCIQYMHETCRIIEPLMIYVGAAMLLSFLSAFWIPCYLVTFTFLIVFGVVIQDIQTNRYLTDLTQCKHWLEFVNQHWRITSILVLSGLSVWLLFQIGKLIRRFKLAMCCHPCVFYPSPRIQLEDQLP